MNSNKVEYLGNKELLKVPKTAFLASCTIAPDQVLGVYDWAIRMAKEGKCVISGFSSHLEREVFHFLAQGKQPIILVIARRMYKELPEELKEPLAQGRLLIISTSSAVRQSKATAHARNKYICELADQVLFIGVTETSSLYILQQQYSLLKTR